MTIQELWQHYWQSEIDRTGMAKEVADVCEQTNKRAFAAGVAGVAFMIGTSADGIDVGSLAEQANILAGTKMLNIEIMEQPGESFSA